MEKIVVHCPTEELWDRVQEAAFGKGKRWSSNGNGILDYWHDDTVESCINIHTYYLERHNRSYYKDKGYTIITAQEYLGGKDVKEFKVTNDLPDSYSISLESSEDMDRVKESKIIDCSYLDCSTDYGYHTRITIEDKKVISFGGKTIEYTVDEWLRRSTKPKTTKENNMKDNNIDSNVLAIFGDKVKGNELVVIDRHFTDNMLKEILMEKHHKAIQEACDVAEAKRLEKESKE